LRASHPSDPRRCNRFEIHTAAVGAYIRRRTPGGVARLRYRFSSPLPVWAAGVSGVHSYRLGNDAVHLCGMGGQAHRIALRTPWSARWSRRCTGLHRLGVGSAPAPAVQDCSRTQGRRWHGGRRSGVAPKTSRQSRHADLEPPDIGRMVDTTDRSAGCAASAPRLRHPDMPGAHAVVEESARGGAGQSALWPGGESDNGLTKRSLCS